MWLAPVSGATCSSAYSLRINTLQSDFIMHSYMYPFAISTKTKTIITKRLLPISGMYLLIFPENTFSVRFVVLSFSFLSFFSGSMKTFYFSHVRSLVCLICKHFSLAEIRRRRGFFLSFILRVIFCLLQINFFFLAVSNWSSARSKWLSSRRKFTQSTIDNDGDDVNESYQIENPYFFFLSFCFFHSSSFPCSSGFSSKFDSIFREHCFFVCSFGPV